MESASIGLTPRITAYDILGLKSVRDTSHEKLSVMTLLLRSTSSTDPENNRNNREETSQQKHCDTGQCPPDEEQIH